MPAVDVASLVPVLDVVVVPVLAVVAVVPLVRSIVTGLDVLSVPSPPEAAPLCSSSAPMRGPQPSTESAIKNTENRM